MAHYVVMSLFKSDTLPKLTATINAKIEYYFATLGCEAAAPDVRTLTNHKTVQKQHN